jgi:hypothetical protein
MIRHHPECVELDRGMMDRDLEPAPGNRLAHRAEQYSMMNRLPRMHLRSRVHTVTKYAPDDA